MPWCMTQIPAYRIPCPGYLISPAEYQRDFALLRIGTSETFLRGNPLCLILLGIPRSID